MKNRIQKSCLYLINFIVLLGISWVVKADGINAQMMQPAIGPENVVTIEGTQTQGQWKPMVQGFLEWAYHPLVLRNPDNGTILNVPVPYMATLHSMGGVGFTNWFHLGLDVPVVLYQAPQDIGTGGGPHFSTTSSGIGDIRMVAKFRLLNNQEGGFGIAAIPQVIFPTGNGAFFRGSDAFELELLRFAFEYRTKSGIFIALNLGFVFRSSEQILFDTRVSHQIRYGIGGYIPLPKSLGVFAEIAGSTSIFNGKNVYSPLESSVGIRWIHKKTGMNINAGFSLGLVRSPGTSDRVFAGVGWLPIGEIRKATPIPPSDRDGDGISDLQDACPDEPGLVQFKGCPDRDRDGIIDREDSCPDEPGLIQFKGCPDHDKDGIPDAEDNCPDEPGPKEFHGCPDRDRDGIIDREDSCPDEPGPKEFHGCPDRDRDGIIDREDSCPDEPGPKEFQGCPDRDQDGIPDREDRCPDSPGFKPTGCPAVKKFVSVTREKIELLQKILFATNKATISPASFPLLDEVVEVLKERPTLKVLIEGHTDNRGGLDHNINLSRARAKAVLDYIAGHGIEHSRLQSEGYGPTRPIADNTTLEGQDKNRRTEFVILQQ